MRKAQLVLPILPSPSSPHPLAPAFRAQLLTYPLQDCMFLRNRRRYSVARACRVNKSVFSFFFFFLLEREDQGGSCNLQPRALSNTAKFYDGDWGHGTAKSSLPGKDTHNFAS
jgi:hypothetical protein